MIVFSTDNRMSNNQSSFHLVFFKVDDIALRYTELSAEQQVEANKIYPVTFEARQAFRQSREAVEQMRAADGACDFDHVMLALEGHSTCQNCGAIPPHR